MFLYERDQMNEEKGIEKGISKGMILGNIMAMRADGKYDGTIKVGIQKTFNLSDSQADHYLSMPIKVGKN